MTATAAPRVTRAVAGFDPIPSRQEAAAVNVDVVAAPPEDATVIGLPVFADGPEPERQDLDRATLEASGFGASIGETLVLPRVDGPTIIEMGLGPHAALDAAALRDAAASVARAAVRHPRVAIDLRGVTEVDARVAGQAVTEGVLMARYRYRAFKDSPSEAHLSDLTLITSRDMVRSMSAGAERGRVTAGRSTSRATCATRRRPTSPPRPIADVASQIGAETGLEVEVFDQAALIEMGCGGLLGVNAGSAEEARLIKLTYRPRGRPSGHLALVGKGIMYDAGGISLKPSDAMHAADEARHVRAPAAILGAMSRCAISAAGRPSPATSCAPTTCRPARPPRLGDVLTIRGGKTVEVVNADAEGRLVMADGISSSRSRTGADAIVTIATLTGAAMRTFGIGPGAGARQRPRISSTSCAPPVTRPTSRSGSCRSSASTAASSIRRSPTSRTWAASTPARSPPRCSSRTSSTGPRSATSTSAVRWSSTPTTAGDRPVPPPSARACWRLRDSTSADPRTTRAGDGNR